MKLIVNTDGGARGNPGPGAAGVVIKNEKGELVDQLSEYLGIVTNNQAEYRAVGLALEYLKNNLENFPEVTTVEFVLDSELVVRQLMRIYKLKNAELLDLANQIWADIDLLPFKVSFRHVMRTQNIEADKLVNSELDKRGR